MKKILVVLIGSMFFVSQSFCVDELSRIQSEIKQVEQKNKKLEEQVKKSEKNVAQTKQDLVRTADRVSSLEEQRGKMQVKIEELDARREKIQKEMIENRGRVFDSIYS